MQSGGIFAHGPSGNIAVNGNVTAAGQKPGFIQTTPQPQPPQIYCAVVRSRQYRYLLHETLTLFA